MVKSKYHAKVQEKVGVKAKVKKTKSKYYDEQIATSQTSKSNSGFAIFVIVCIIIGASVSGILIANNNNNDNNNGTDPNGTEPGIGIQDGDFVTFKYEFYVDVNHDYIFSDDELMDHSEFYEWTIEEDSDQGFPPGLYNNMLGMVEGQIEDIVLIANIDADEDGFDDITGKPVESFGSGPLANTALKYHVEIFTID